MIINGFFLDFHIEPSGSAIWYYNSEGSMSFFLAKPTHHNLKCFTEWYENNDTDSEVLFSDICKEIYRVDIEKGDFLLIPSGYIYSFYCNENSILYTGNFLHGYDIYTELNVRDIEENLKFPPELFYPEFYCQLWYAAQNYLADLRSINFDIIDDNKIHSSHELNGLPTLISFFFSKFLVLLIYICLCIIIMVSIIFR